MELTGHKILITGASDGIGKALAQRFAALGNRIIAVGRQAEKLRAMAQTTPNVTMFTCDLAQPDALRGLVQFIEHAHADLNVLINNAGIQFNYDFYTAEDHTPQIELEIRTNLLAPIQLTSLLLPTLSRRPTAAIVNVTSGLGFVPKRSAPVYCGTKAGLHIFTQAFRYQSPHVKVFEIIPPLVDTSMTQGRGRGKISPDALVDEFLRAWQRDQYEVSIGKVKLLRGLHRWLPSVAARIMRDGL